MVGQPVRGWSLQGGALEAEEATEVESSTEGIREESFGSWPKAGPPESGSLGSNPA